MDTTSDNPLPTQSPFVPQNLKLLPPRRRLPVLLPNRRRSNLKLPLNQLLLVLKPLIPLDPDNHFPQFPDYLVRLFHWTHLLVPVMGFLYINDLKHQVSAFCVDPIPENLFFLPNTGLYSHSLTYLSFHKMHQLYYFSQ